MKNLMSKSRKPSGERPYITLVDERMVPEWTYQVLKSYQQDGSKPYARVFCLVDGFAEDLGDVYVDDLKGARIIDFDRDVFASENDARVALFGV